ncbi:hypothetical protein BKN38_05130 [Helicobacter sp. CLO-3]|uniref:CapA family protein n=1 Tax=unclassified Helicobacter TaxID=2593540 RepID=UPI0008DAB553|nr:MULTISPECIES: CapA family protein [unclassified Helicobacter]OHU83706.1 hypothetical protein BKN38_05130 [Helicobacter sp. CLO-3]
MANRAGENLAFLRDKMGADKMFGKIAFAGALACLCAMAGAHLGAQDLQKLKHVASVDSSTSAESSTSAKYAASAKSGEIVESSVPKQRGKIFARAHSLQLIMAGDALLHTAVFKDAEELAKSLNKAKAESSKIDSNASNTESTKAESKGAESKKVDSGNAESSASNAESSTNATTPAYYFDPMFDNISHFIKRADLAFYNQETILGGSALGLSSYPAFNSPQEFGDTMLRLGFRLVSLANNHTLDRGEKGVRAMLEYWHAKERAHSDLCIAGSYESANDRAKSRIYEKNGISYAMLAYTYGTNGIKIPEGKDYLVNVYTKQMLQDDIAALRDKVDLLIASMHWGVEYSFVPSKEQREFAAFLASLGVDIIIGNHPHVIQPIERIGDTLVIYSLGNFISGQKGTNKRIGMLASVRVSLLSAKELKRKAKEMKKAEKERAQGLNKGEADKNSGAQEAGAQADEKSTFLHRVRLDDVRAELIYTQYDSNMRNFKLYPLRKVDDKILPESKKIYKEYTKIIDNDLVKIGL